MVYIVLFVFVILAFVFAFYKINNVAPVNIDELSQKADEGHEDSRYELMMLFYTNKDPEVRVLSFKWALYIAKRHGDGGAMMQLGDMYYNGLGTEVNEETALYWYKKALDTNYNPPHATDRNHISRQIKRLEEKQ